MTAIAYRDGILATDRQVTWSKVATVADKHRKIDVPGYGLCLVCLSGFVYAEERIFRQLEHTTVGDGQDIGDTNAQARYGFLITKDLKVHGVYGDGTVGVEEHYENKFFAEGSAFDFLMGAMANGASAHTAVRLACEYLDGCGQGINVIDVRQELGVCD